MIAKLAYLTSPAPNRFVLNYQEEGDEGIKSLEISKGHLANIVITATSLAWNEQSSVFHRVSSNQETGNAHEPSPQSIPS